MILEVVHLIWFFLAGMIAGAVGMVMYSDWWMEKHIRMRKLTLENIVQEIKESQNGETNEDKRSAQD